MSGFFGKLFGFGEEEGEEIPDDPFSSKGYIIEEINLNNPILIIFLKL